MRIRTLATLLILLLAMFAGCGPEAETASDSPSAAATSSATRSTVSECAPISPAAATTESVGLVLGNRANSKRASRTRLACYLDPLLDRSSHVVAAVSDGRPRAVFDGRLADLPDGRRKIESKRRFASELARALDAPAAAPEADVLEALGLVVQALRADPAGPRLVLINDSLLQTTGALPLQRGYLYADGDDVVAELRPYLDRTLGDLHGYTAVLMAPGAVRAPQERVTAENRTRIIALWRDLLTSRGARVVIDEGVVFEDPPGADDLPSVTSVPMEPPAPPTSSSRSGEPCRTELSSRQVAFVADSARFLDPERARATIRAVAKRIAAARGRCALSPSKGTGRIRMIGTTSSAGSEAGRKKVSTARARAVRTELAAALAVRPSTIEAVGVGMHFDGFVDDRRADGSLDSIKAQRNRLVIIEVRPA